MEFKSKLPHVGTTIFTVMSALAEQHKAINLSQGFPNFDCPHPLQELVHDYMKMGMNQYAPMPGLLKLRERLAAKIESLYALDVDPLSEITITAGGTQSLFSAIGAFVGPGDEVILIEPAYDSYKPGIELFGGKVVAYELAAPDFKVDWVAFERLITPKTRMIMINTPHNPTGMILNHQDMLALQRITEGTDIIVLSDEVYEHLIFDGEVHESVFRYPALFKRSLLTFSFGKTFHATGWKMGYCVGPATLMTEFRKIHQFNVFSANTPIQYAIADYLEDPYVYLHLNDFYQQKRNYFLEVIKGSRFQPMACKGTYFQLLDYSEISDEPDKIFAERITRDFGVATIHVSVFYSNGRDERVIRVCFAKTEETLEKAGILLKKI